MLLVVEPSPDTHSQMIAGKVTIRAGTEDAGGTSRAGARRPPPGMPANMNPMPSRRAWMKATPMTPAATERAPLRSRVSCFGPCPDRSRLAGRCASSCAAAGFRVASMIAAMINALMNSRTAIAVLAAAAEALPDRLQPILVLADERRQVGGCRAHTASIFLPTISHRHARDSGAGYAKSVLGSSDFLHVGRKESPSMTVGTPSTRTLRASVRSQPPPSAHVRASLAFRRFERDRQDQPQIMRLANGANTRAHRTARKTIRPKRTRVSNRSLDRIFRPSFVGRHGCLLLRGFLIVSQAAIELNNRFLDDEHHDDDDDRVPRSPWNGPPK